MDYPLPDSPAEHRRLKLQGHLYASATRSFLLEAGICEGMRVLDFGCGIGEVTALIAHGVGKRGKVVGVDQPSQALAAARARFVDQPNISFLPQIPRRGKFDAVVGQLVLMYCERPEEILQRLAALVRPNGVIAFQEADHKNYMSTNTPSALFELWRLRILNTAVACGIELSMELRLKKIFTAAKLPRPWVHTLTQIDKGDRAEICRLLAKTAHSFWPKMKQHGFVPREARFPTRLTNELYTEAAQLDLTFRALAW